MSIEYVYGSSLGGPTVYHGPKPPRRMRNNNPKNSNKMKLPKIRKFIVRKVLGWDHKQDVSLPIPDPIIVPCIPQYQAVKRYGGSREFDAKTINAYEYDIVAEYKKQSAKKIGLELLKDGIIAFEEIEEGGVLKVVGLLIVIDPNKTTI